MAHLEFSKEITALLVIDPDNEFISRVRRPSTTGPPGSGPRKAVVVINSRIVGNAEGKGECLEKERQSAGLGPVDAGENSSSFLQSLL